MTDNQPDTEHERLHEQAARESAYLQHAYDLQHRFDELAEELHSLRKRVRNLERTTRKDHQALRRHQAQIKRLRIDRQLAGIPRWLLGRIRGRIASHSRVDEQAYRVTAEPRRTLLIVAHKYPSVESPYGGQPIERRVRFYRSAGFETIVFVPSNDSVSNTEKNGVRVVRDHLPRLEDLAMSLGSPQLCIHSPTPELWDVAKRLVDRLVTHVWIHGFEARDWRELTFNYSSEELEARSTILDAITVQRRKTLIDVFGRANVTKIFVSEFMRRTAESFAGVSASNAHTIHNVVDTGLFGSAQPKEESLRLRVLVVRSFAARNYGTDLVARTIRLLSGEDWFDRLSFDIRGDGRYFQEDTAGLTDYANVSIQQGIVQPDSLAILYREHGTLLIPTRWDSQGMTMGEGMVAGLVPVTNRVAAIPEFADESCAVLSDPEDAEGLASGITRIYRDPQAYREMSARAIQRAVMQCGPENTVNKEIQILERSLR